jgi:hypothetical protein
MNTFQEQKYQDTGGSNWAVVVGQYHIPDQFIIYLYAAIWGRGMRQAERII